TVALWDLRAGGAARTIAGDGLPQPPGPIAFGRDPATLFIAGRSGGVVACEVATGRRRWAADVPASAALAVSPDGGRLACAGRQVRILDTTSGDVVRVLPEVLGGLGAVTFSPDGRLVLAGGGGKLI